MSAYASILRPGLLLYVAYREDGTRCAVSVPSGSTVARVKASFLRARRGQGHHLSVIDLHFRGQRLEDGRPLLSYGLRRGDEIEAKVPDNFTARLSPRSSTSAMQTERAIEFYLEMDEGAAALARARAGAVPPPSPSRTDMWSEDSTASASASASAFNDGFVLDPRDEAARSSSHRFQITRAPSSPKMQARDWAEDYRRTTQAFQQRQREASQRQNFGDVEDGDRTLRPRYACTVDGCEFSLLHRLEGRWSGVLEPGGRLASSRLEFVKGGGEMGAHWKLTETLTAPEGVSTVETSLLVPIASGMLSVVSAANAGGDGSAATTRTTIREMGTQILVTQTFDRASNELLLLETTTVLDPRTCTTRVRVSQIYDQAASGGAAVSLFCVTEARTSADVHLVPRAAGAKAAGRRPRPPMR
jgi:hypothetical protein